LVGTFTTGENVNVTIIDSTDNTLITLELN